AVFSMRLVVGVVPLAVVSLTNTNDPVEHNGECQLPDAYLAVESMVGSSKSEGSTVGGPSDHTLLLAELLQICGEPWTVQPPTMSTFAYGRDEVPIDVLFFPWYTPPMYTEPVCAAGGIRL